MHVCGRIIPNKFLKHLEYLEMQCITPAHHIGVSYIVIAFVCYIFICFLPLFSPVDPETDVAPEDYYVTNDPSSLLQQSFQASKTPLIIRYRLFFLSYACIRIASVVALIAPILMHGLISSTSIDTLPAIL